MLVNTNNPVPWRGDSCTNDAAGYQLQGGFYDGGDNLKFTYPIATTTAFLAWSMLEFEGGYRWGSGCAEWPPGCTLGQCQFAQCDYDRPAFYSLLNSQTLITAML